MSKLINIKCKYCNKFFISYISNNRKYCSKICTNKSKIGGTSWNKGIKTRPEIVEKIRKAHMGTKHKGGWHHSDESKRKISIANKGEKNKNFGKSLFGKENHFFGKNHSNETKLKISKKNKGRLSGSKNHSWKGGVTRFGKLVRHSYKNKIWISNIFRRDNFTCQKCNKRGGDLEAHHIKEFNKILKEYNIKTIDEAYKCEELWDLDNGLTLCKECHRKINK